MGEILKIKSVTQFHQLIGLPSPQHPLISLISDENRVEQNTIDDALFDMRFTSDMYAILYKEGISGELGYGRTSYDFQEGTLLFVGPDQVFAPPTREQMEKEDEKGWSLIFHPDLIRKSSLGENMGNYSFFSYEVNEALHLSEKEREFIFKVAKQIKEEYSQNIDKHSQRLIISNLELLLNYCTRFYDRQFYTRTNFNKDIVSVFESKLKAYFNSEKPAEMGLPTANYFGKELNTSPSYLSDLLKKETGSGMKDHINKTIVERAKTILLSSNKSVSEIAFSLGFEYPQSFTRLFKNKTGLSPKGYRTLN